MVRINNRLLTILTTALMLPMTANAEKYLVQFKSEQTFLSFSAAIKDQKKLMGQFSSGPVRSGVQFFNSQTQVTDAFEALQMVVVEADGDIDTTIFENHPNIEFIEKEQMLPAPEPVNIFATYSTDLASDVEFATPWGLDAIDVEGAWDLNGEGEGIRVLVLDTGVDKDHPSVAEALVEAKDFSASKGLPYDYFDDVGHGTHVAGTVLGQRVGVAPGASLYVGKVCSNDGCSTLAIAAGLNYAIETGVDVVNMSLGGPFPTNSKLYSAAEAADVLIIAAAGNEGKKGISYPAGQPTVFAVGAMDKNYARADFSQWGAGLDLVAPGTEVLSAVPLGTGLISQAKATLGNKDSELLESTPMQGSAVTDDLVEQPLVYIGLGKTEDVSGVDLSGKIALIQRGEIAFGEKAANAFHAGAEGVIVFNNAPGMIRGSLEAEMSIPVVMVSQEAGQALVEGLESSEVIASVGVLRSDYAELQGTSMASPHVAGVAALVRAANPHLTASQVRELLKRTTTALDGDNSENQLGTGLVNAKQAVEAAMNLIPLAHAN